MTEASKAERDDPPDRMVKIEKLIADMQSIRDKFGNTCVYIRRGGMSWGAVALNYRSDDEKYGVFDLQAEHDREMIARAEQIERLKADRDYYRSRANVAEQREAALSAPAPCAGEKEGVWRDALQRIAARAPDLDSLELSRAFRELREITAMAAAALAATPSPPRQGVENAVMSKSAQTTALNWLRVGIKQANRLSRTVSGEGEHAEILTTLLAMIEQQGTKNGELRTSLQIALDHIDHMSAWINKQNAGYSFESLGEDMPDLRALLRPERDGR